MDKVLLIVSDNNKGKFIAKGFTDAFRELSFFVFEKKNYDLTFEEIVKIFPDIIFVFWTDMSQKDELVKLLRKYHSQKTVFMHCAELCSDIPNEYGETENHYIFASDVKNPKYRFISSIGLKEYTTQFCGYNYNLTFAGNPAYKNREIILSKLIYNFGHLNIFCRSFDFYKSMDEIYKSDLLNDKFLEMYEKSYKGYVNSQKELAEIYASSKINIDMKSEIEKDINYRFLEITASGGFLIAPYNKNNYFEDGREFESYVSADDLVDKIKFYLKNINIAKVIGKYGRKNTISNFSCYNGLKKILEAVYGKDFGCR